MNGVANLVRVATTTFAAMTVCFVGACLPAQDDFSAELPRIPPTAPADALETFQVVDGFRMEQVAAEPLVTSPVAIEWDANGRMYVCEMRGYSEDQEDGISRITRLEDTDDDGVYDTSIVYADGLMWPTGLFPYDDGLFVGDAPHLYYFKDTDGDGKADSKRTVLTGFGTSNVQGLMNSFRWGLDNRMHIACSSVGGMIRHSRDDESKAVNVRGRDIALDPKQETFELTSGAAQHGMCFDDWGRKFVSSNSNHIQQVMYEDRYIARNPLLKAPPSRISIAADGPQAEVFRTSPVEPWRIVRTRLRVGGLVRGPIEGGGRAAGYFTGATGITIYRGDAWPDDMKGLAIIGDVGSNLIHRKRLERNGLEFVAKRIDQQREFVTSSDIWFRPAQFANAPDGTLHVIDVCREVIEHPKSLPPDIKKHLDLTSGRDRGRIYRIAPDGYKHRKTPRLSDASITELVQALEHPNAWHRETAARLLFERQDMSAIGLLKDVVKKGESPLGRMHAMHALAGLGALDVDSVLRGLRDQHPQVRRHAVLLSEGVADPGGVLTAEIDMRASDESMDVRYQVAFTIGSQPIRRRFHVLQDVIARDPGDVWIQAAVQSSLGAGAGEMLARLVGNGPPLRSDPQDIGPFLQRLASQISKQDRPDDITMAIEGIDDLEQPDPALFLPVIGELLASRTRKGSAVAKLAASGEFEHLDAAVDDMIGKLCQTASNSSGSTASRVNAVNALAYAPLDKVESTLVAAIDNRQPHQLQQAAITTLGTFNSTRISKPLLEAWRGLSPRLRETAAEVLFARPERTLALFAAIDAKQLSLSDLSKARLQVAAKSKHEAVKTQAIEYLNSTGTKRRGDVVEAYRGSLELEGDLARGKTLFQKHCAVCHKVEGFGHEIGPSLAAIKTRGAETILVNVLDPNREVNPQYLNYVVLTQEGRAMTGMISAESASSVTLRRAEAATDTVLRVDIEQLQSTGLSIMPEGMEETIDQQAMADIIAYLMQVK